MKTGWSPIKDLAAAVPLDALTKICEPCDNSHRQRAVSEDLEWMFSDETDQRFSFVRLVGYWRLNQASLENLFCCVSTNLQ